MKTAKEILDRIVQDGTGIEITQDEALMAMKEIAELAWVDGLVGGFSYFMNSSVDPLYEAPTKEQFINKLFQ